MISDINIHIDRDICYACGICVERCILDNLRLSVAPCRQACPIFMNCQGYIRLIAQGRQREAAEEMRQDTPFGAILGRVCSHPCEAVCERGPIDGPVHIRALKRYLADAYADISSVLPKIANETGRRAAVVGSGPAGLMAAYELRTQGHRVTVYEAENEPGGLLRFAIPSFRLPQAEVERAVEMLEHMGLSFKTGQAVGRQIELERLEQEFDAVVVALGGGALVDLEIAGRELEGVFSGLEILKQVKEGKALSLGESVIVIGGGNSAVDAALTCRKLGVPEVRVVCLEDRSQMPAFTMELHEAHEEGVIIENGWGPARFLQQHDGKIEVELSRCLSLFDDQGDFHPTLEQTCGHRLNARSVIVATGQRVKIDDVPKDLLDPETKRLKADPLTQQSVVREKVFVCGDCFSGSSSVVEAMASGREAAISADRFLRGDGLHWGRQLWNGPYIKAYEVDPARAKGGPRGDLGRTAVAERTLHLEVERTMSAQDARTAAERCLSCGRAAEINRTCWYCLPCEIECPVDALTVRMPYLVR